jgi:hypothetical protein
MYTQMILPAYSACCMCLYIIHPQRPSSSRSTPHVCRVASYQVRGTTGTRRNAPVPRSRATSMQSTMPCGCTPARSIQTIVQLKLHPTGRRSGNGQRGSARCRMCLVLLSAGRMASRRAFSQTRGAGQFTSCFTCWTESLEGSAWAGDLWWGQAQAGGRPAPAPGATSGEQFVEIRLGLEIGGWFSRTCRGRQQDSLSSILSETRLHA